MYKKQGGINMGIGIATININKKDDSTVWGFDRTWIEFYPALLGTVKKIYIPESLALLLMNENRYDLYTMFRRSPELLDEYKMAA